MTMVVEIGTIDDRYATRNLAVLPTLELPLQVSTYLPNRRYPSGNC